MVPPEDTCGAAPEGAKKDGERERGDKSPRRISACEKATTQEEAVAGRVQMVLSVGSGSSWSEYGGTGR